MAEQMRNQEQELSEQRRVRREKLAELQKAGQDPFQITRVQRTATSEEIKEIFD